MALGLADVIGIEPPSVTWQGHDAETDTARGMIFKVAISPRCAFMDSVAVVTAATCHAPIAG